MKLGLRYLLPVILFGCASNPEAENTGTTAQALSTVSEVTGFGTNPGALQMFEYVPSKLSASPPLVVVVHGCTQGATDAAASGWNDLADANGFVVVYPQQTTSNNPVRCFNWAGEYGDPSNIQRGKGENESIKEMVDKAKATHGIDPNRVFIVGFSAGGAMAAVIAATWPDVFAGGGIMAGVPYDCTTTYSEVSNCQSPGKTKTAAQWGDLVRAAYPGATKYPRMSIWQGSADTTVGTANRMELVKQWTNVLGVPETATTTDTVDGQSHASFADANGKVLVETYEVAGMAHAVPIAKGCGTASTYAVDKGICGPAHLVSFFGLDGSAPPTTTDGGASSSSSSSSSGGASSSSSSSSSSSTSSGGGKGGNGASPSGDDGDLNRGAGSTCSLGHGTSNTNIPLFLVALAALGSRIRRGKK